MTKDEALKLALEALERGETGLRWKAITAIKEALAQPVIDKSAAVRIATSLGWEPKRTWVGLSDEEIVSFTCECVDDGTFNVDCAHDFGKSIELALKQRNT